MRTFLYRPGESKLFDISAQERKRLIDSGEWYDSPADIGKEPEEEDLDDVELLLDRFGADPYSLNQKELVKLGRGIGAGIRRNFSVPVLVSKISDFLEVEYANGAGVDNAITENPGD